LLHGEALLVVTAGDLEDVALELLAHKRTIELSSHASVVKGTDILLFVNFNLFLATSSGVRNVELHL